VTRFADRCLTESSSVAKAQRKYRAASDRALVADTRSFPMQSLHSSSMTEHFSSMTEHFGRTPSSEVPRPIT
jgi:hypothetical protein